MRSSSVYCSLCGAPANDASDGWTPKPWMKRMRYVIADGFLNSNKGSGLSSFPFLTNEGRVKPAPMPYAEVMHQPSGFFIQADVNVFRAWLNDDMERGWSVGYVVHDSCWKIYNAMFDDSGRTDAIRKRMATLHEILENTSSSSWKMNWPHGYHGLSKSHQQFWESTGYEYALEDPWDIPSVNHVTADMIAESDTIPHILPLPIELIEQVYSDLDWRDLERLQQIETKKRTRLSDAFWKSFLKPRGELGFLLIDRMDQKPPQFSWFQVFCLAKFVLKTNSFQNRRRVWRMCKALANQVLDISESRPIGLESIESQEQLPPTFTSTEKSCMVESESYQSWNKIFIGTKAIFEGQVCANAVSEVILYYCGTDSLRFLCGIALLPSGDKLGYITKRSRLVLIPKAEIIYLSIAFSRYGVVDVSFSKKVDEAEWGLKDEEFDERRLAVQRRTLSRATKSNLKIHGQWDASRITVLSIGADGLLDIEKHNSSGVSVDDYSWLPRIPPSSLSLGSLKASPVPHQQTWVAPPKFKPLEQAIFHDAPLTRITCFSMGVYKWISGISFHFENPEQNPPLTIGEESGSVIDFLINGKEGEHIKSISAIVEADADAYLNGILIETSSKRKGIFTGRDMEQQCKLERCRAIPKVSQIKGIYASIHYMPDYDRVWISRIGVITSGEAKYDTLSLPSLSSLDSVVNTPINLPMKRWNSPAMLMGADGGHFSSQADLRWVNTITCYIKEAGGPRLRGMLFDYGKGVTKVLGQISLGIPDSQVMQLSNGEYIRSIKLYTNRPERALVRHVHILGMRVETTWGGELLWGEEAGSEPVEVLRPKLNQGILRWDFNHLYDLVWII